MPALFLVVSLVGACFTWNAVRPIFLRPAPLALASFFAGWLTSELVLHHLAWQALATVFFMWAGALDAWPGRLGLLITIGSWAALARAWVRARDTGVVVDAALAEGLGEDWHERVPEALRPTPAPTLGALPWRTLLAPIPVPRHPDVERERDLVFATEGRLRLKLDVWRPRAPGRRRPSLLFIHGGAWVIGTKDQQGLPLVQHLAARGWVCFNANYRLSPRATFPDHLVDVKRAIRWVREHAEEHGADPDFVVVAGGSAGGHLAALAALTANDPAYQPGFEESDTRVQGCVPLYGVYDFADRHREWPHDGLLRIVEKHVIKQRRESAREVFDRASPIAQVHADAPPFLVVHGEHDSLVPPGDARRFVEALRRAGARTVVHAEVPGAQHAFEVFPSVRTLQVLDGVARFGAWAHARHLEERGASREPSGAVASE